QSPPPVNMPLRITTSPRPVRSVPPRRYRRLFVFYPPPRANPTVGWRTVGWRAGNHRGRVMDDDASPEPTTGSDGGAAIQPGPAGGSFHADSGQMKVSVERRLRRLAGRKGAYRGPI